MLSKLPLLTILVSGITCLIPAAVAEEKEGGRKQGVQQQILQEVRSLRDEVAELQKQLSEMRSTLKALENDRKAIVEPQVRSTAAPAPQSDSKSGHKYKPRRYWDSISDDRGEELRAAEKSATPPLWQWSLSEAWTVHSVVVAKDNRTVLAGGERGEWRLCDLATGEVLQAHEHPEMQQIHKVAITPDGQTLALDSDKGVYLVARDDPTQQRHIKQFRSVWALDFSSDGKFLALASTDGKIRVLRVDDLSLAHELDTGGHFVKDVRFSDDGRRLATSGGYYNNRIPAEGETGGVPVSGLWDIATGLSLFEVETDPRLATNLVAELVPGQSVLVVTPRDVSIWSLPEKERTLTIRDRGDGNSDVSVDGHTLLLALDDDHLGIFDMRTGRLTKSLLVPSHWRFDACLSPDGRYVVAGGWDGGIRAWDLH